MLVRKRIPVGMILRIDGLTIASVALLSTVIYFAHHHAGFKVAIPLSVVATLGTAVAILLGFKNNAAYDRWWEARKIWGGIVNQSRYLTSQMVAYIDKGESSHSPEHGQLLRELVHRHLAYIYVLKSQLRENSSDEPIRTWLGKDEVRVLSAAKNKATQILTNQSVRFRVLHEGKRFDQFRFFEFMATIREFFELQGKAERIKNTPLMRHYSYFTTAFVWVFVLFLPLGFVGQMDWKMIPLVVLVSTIFTMLDRAGTFTEAPFENSMNDVAMDAICRTIEIDMLQQIGESDIPDQISPVDGILL